MIEDEQIESLVFLPQQAGFVKFGTSGTLSANLTKSPLIFISVSLW